MLAPLQRVLDLLIGPGCGAGVGCGPSLSGSDGERRPAALDGGELDSVPDTVVIEILAFLDLEDHLKISLVSRRCQRISNDPGLWRRHWIYTFGALWASKFLDQGRPSRRNLTSPNCSPYGGWSKEFFIDFSHYWRRWVLRGFIALNDADNNSVITELHGKFIDITSFLREHPGSPSILRGVRGSICTPQFVGHHSFFAQTHATNFIVRSIEAEAENTNVSRFPALRSKNSPRHSLRTCVQNSPFRRTINSRKSKRDAKRNPAPNDSKNMQLMKGKMSLGGIDSRCRICNQVCLEHYSESVLDWKYGLSNSATFTSVVDRDQLVNNKKINCIE